MTRYPLPTQDKIISGTFCRQKPAHILSLGSWSWLVLTVKSKMRHGHPSVESDLLLQQGAVSVTCPGCCVCSMSGLSFSPQILNTVTGEGGQEFNCKYPFFNYIP